MLEGISSLLGYGPERCHQNWYRLFRHTLAAKWHSGRGTLSASQKLSVFDVLRRFTSFHAGAFLFLASEGYCDLRLLPLRPLGMSFTHVVERTSPWLQSDRHYRFNGSEASTTPNNSNFNRVRLKMMPCAACRIHTTHSTILQRFIEKITERLNSSKGIASPLHTPKILEPSRHGRLTLALTWLHGSEMSKPELSYSTCYIMRSSTREQPKSFSLANKMSCKPVRGKA